jgi:hypothetical protein
VCDFCVDAFVYDKPPPTWIARQDLADGARVPDVVFDRPKDAIPCRQAANRGCVSTVP